MRSSLGFSLLASGALAIPATAHADSFQATRSEALVERDHDIALTLDYGHAELVVQRTVYNGGERHDQAMFWIDVPEGGVAVGLRTLAMKNGRPHWYDGELLEAELAARRYQELTGIGGWYPKDPALLSWRSAEQLLLQVFPCPPSEKKSVEYTIVLPTTYADGRYTIALPQMGTEALTARVEVTGASPRDQIFVDDMPVGRGDVVMMDAEHTFGLARAAAPSFEGGVAVVPFGEDKALFHYDFEAAAAISKVPRKADVVVLMDSSRSLGADEHAAEVALARSYLSHFKGPDSRAALVAFDRRPDDLLGGFTSVRQARGLLETLVLEPGNGSNVDDALALADKLLDESAPGRARRIVLMTDRRTRASFAIGRVGALARRTGAIVHVVDTTDVGGTELVRDEEGPWSAVARDTGGVLWNARVDVTSDVTERNAVFEELARPVRVDDFAVRVPGIATSAFEVPTTLDEGAATTALLVVDSKPEHVIVTGELWSTPLRKVLVPNAEQATLWSALAFGTEVIEGMSDAEMMVLAQRGRAVSPVTSYLAIEPGVRPSTEGLEQGEGFGVGGIGLFGTGSGSGGSGFGRGPKVDLDRAMRAHAIAALDACAAPTGTATLVIESTLAEIVDVGALSVGGDPVVEDCVREQMWQVALEHAFDREFARWDVEVTR